MARHRPEQKRRKERRGQGRSPYKEQEGIGLSFQQTAGPENTATRDLLLDERVTEALLKFLRAVRVGELKSGALDRG